MGVVRRTVRVMGTVASIEVVDHGDADGAESAVAAVDAWLTHVDTNFSVHRPLSLVNRVARGEVSAMHPVLGDDLLEVLDRCASLLIETDGVFDAWAVRSPEGLMFDPSGYVKGWAIERAADVLVSTGFVDHCIDVGGDLSVSGRDVDGAAWRIGLRDPDDAHRCAAVLSLAPPPGSRLGVATSGSYERGAHIVDPRRGVHATEIASATVLGPSIADADAYATALYVMGVDGLAWLARHPGFEGCVITRDRTVLSTSGFDRHVGGWPVAAMVRSD